MNFSVLMSIYKGTKLPELTECMESLLSQTVKSDDIVVVFDGPVSDDVAEYIGALAQKNPEIHEVKFESNRGLGPALRDGTEACKNELIARMDTDDICVPDRFEQQLKVFENDPDVSVVGGNIAEFMGSRENIVARRIVPENNTDIYEFAKKRCPMNHVTVMFKKTDVLAVGGYMELYCDEDYYLWVRMILGGKTFYNIQSDLVLVRTDSMAARRGGMKYYKAEKRLFKFMRKNKMIGAFAYAKAKFIRFILYVLMPSKMRSWAFRKFARN